MGVDDPSSPPAANYAAYTPTNGSRGYQSTPPPTGTLAYSPPEGTVYHPDPGPADPNPPSTDGKKDGDTIRATGAFVASGIMKAATTVQVQIHRQAEKRKEKATPRAEPTSVNPSHMKAAHGLNQATQVTAKTTRKVVEVIDDTIVKAARTIAGSTDAAGRPKKESTGVKAYVKASIYAVNDVMDAGEKGVKDCVTSAAVETEAYVRHVHGEEAALLAHEYGMAAKNTTDTTMNVLNLPTNPKGVVKKVAKCTAKEVVRPGRKKTHAEKELEREQQQLVVQLQHHQQQLQQQAECSHSTPQQEQPFGACDPTQAAHYNQQQSPPPAEYPQEQQGIYPPVEHPQQHQPAQLYALASPVSPQTDG